MAVRKALYVRKDDDKAFIGDVIEHEGKSWLVPEWLQGPTAGILCPARIIDIGGLHPQAARPEDRYDLVLATPLSRGVLEGRSVMLGLDVRERPDIHLREDRDFRR